MNECERILNKGLFDPSFLESEVRDGYTVTAKMKAVWMIELDMLMEAQRVFEKYDIPWFAIGGTLLGAVRHKGFIPWDDDIDIAVPREHYNRLQKIGPKEFKAPYFYQNEYNDPGLLCGHAKIRNSNTTCLSPAFFNEHNGCCRFHMGVFIDIFPLDNVPDKEDEQAHWIDEISETAKCAWKLRKYSHRGFPKLDAFLDIKLSHVQDNPNVFFETYDDLLGFYSKEKTAKSCIYCLYRKDKRWIFENRHFAESQYLKFEGFDIRAPQDCEDILTQLYQDWKVMKQVDSMHSPVNGTIFDVNHPYTEYCDPRKGIDKEKIGNIV